MIDDARLAEDLAVRCADCGSSWIDSIALGPGDWFARDLIEGEGNAGWTRLDQVPEEPVFTECLDCGSEVEVDLPQLLARREQLRGQRAFDAYISFKESLVRDLFRLDAVSTALGDFFAGWSDPVKGRNPMTGGELTISGRAGFDFMPSPALWSLAVPGGVSHVEWVAARRSDARVMDVDKDDLLPGWAPFFDLEKPIRSREAPGLLESVTTELRDHRSSHLRGLGTFLVRSARSEDLDGDVVTFAVDALLLARLDRYWRERNSPSPK